MKDVGIYDVDRVIGMIISKHYTTAILDRKELFQIGYLGYLKAVKNYDPIYGDMSLVYATKYIINEINRELIRQRKELHCEYTGYDRATNTEEALIEELTNNERLDLVRKALPSLNEQEKEVILNLYLSNEVSTLKTLGESLGVTKQRIGQIKASAIIKIAKYIKRNK